MDAARSHRNEPEKRQHPQQLGWRRNQAAFERLHSPFLNLVILALGLRFRRRATIKSLLQSGVAAS